MALEFEQQPKESDKAFAAFAMYLSMGPERSLEAVRQKCDKSSRLIQRWSSRWRWTERVTAHASHLATVEREATEALARGKSAQWLKRQEEHRDEEWAKLSWCPCNPPVVRPVSVHLIARRGQAAWGYMVKRLSAHGGCLGGRRR